ncbi:16S rRNA (cytosine(967)-C(5))-methyltransferase RsmB [Coprobacillus sp. AM42-12AC]|uniref:16S rRNA (cytosine(967)-C(5))-methyltransferase RsmB n=1 Tax=Faecalibacillus faecis TaxID=1982628 RepID=UPI000664B6F9|nr:ribosomal RNA small subunit methyltransferase B [Coprobacillus sp. 8_1_38FAA]RHB01984.1 16S rRNA (cytosine(967)-C(5))-methyltransferase RsmB [Coprobacillus sp. AM42-12AC]
MARIHAYRILNQYFEDESFLNIALNEKLKKSELKREDKDLCTTIVYGTIQNLLAIQYQLQPYIKGKRVKKKIKTLLYLSLYQLMYLDKIPEYAVINEAVNIAKKQGYQTSKFVNAVLRNFVRNERRSLEGLDELERISIETSHPLWMVKMFNKQYGLEKTKKICLEDNTPPTRSGRVNTLKASKEELLKEGCFKEGTLSKDALLYDKGNLALTSYFKEGKVTIQDESSQLVARLLNPQKTDYVLDMCSAPGSKTTHLSALMENQGKIEAYDLYEHKVKLVEYNLRRLGVKNVHIQAGDSTKLKEVYPEKTFDCILLDAPCSGFGVLKRKPEIKYHDSSIMDGLVSLQALLLENAYYLLKNDGTMVYSTCTINKKENELMIQKFIEKHPDMEVVKQRTILNYEYHTDGFFMCKMKKG